MAGKLKVGGIKGFLLLHGEKIGIALVAFVALWLIYKTTSLPRLDPKFHADQLGKEVTQTSSAVRDAQWPGPESEQASEVRRYKPMAEKADAAVAVDPYKPVGTFDNTIVAPTVLRTDPVMLNAIDVRATGGSGLLAFLDEQTRKRRELQRAKEAEELQKKQAERQEQEQKAATEGGPGSAGRQRTGRDSELANQPYDPDHPKRRPIVSTAAAVGIPLQGGERIERASWAIVTAKVPIREQLKLYQDAFEKAKLGFDPMRDFPQYRGYVIQRAEVLPGKDLEWKPVATYDGQRSSITGNKPIAHSRGGGVSQQVMTDLYSAAQLVWAGMAPDVIDQRFFEYNLTFPLPPIVGRDWGPEATHPDIPVIAETPPLEQEIATPPPGTTPATPTSIDENSAFTSTSQNSGMTPGPMGPGGRMGMGMPGGEFAMGRRMQGPGGMGPGGMGPEGGMGRSPMMRGGEGGPGGGMSAGVVGSPTQRTSLPKGVDYVLLRFVDFTVEPGKKYKYRVSLVLTDPNANQSLPESVFASEVLDRRAKERAASKDKSMRIDWRKVEQWSDPSPTVGIPLAGDVRLVDSKPFTPDKINDEPVAKMLVESFDIDEKGNAIQAAVEKELRRGAVANFVEDAEYLGDGPWIDTREKFKFITGMTVLDVEGGKKLAKDYTSPSRTLIMGPAGQFYIRDELDDKPAVLYHEMLFTKEHRNLEGPGGMEGPGGRGGPPRGGPRGPR